MRIRWDALDQWFEEDEEVFVHPRSPYVRVDALRSTRHVRIELEGCPARRVAGAGGGGRDRTAQPLVRRPERSGPHPPRAVTDRDGLSLQGPDHGVLVGRASATGSTRTWRGATTSRPSQLLPIAGLVAFYDEQVDVVLDGVRQERPSHPSST